MPWRQTSRSSSAGARPSSPLFALLVDRGDGRGFAEVRVNARRDWEGSVGAAAGAWTAPLRCPDPPLPAGPQGDARDGNGPQVASYFLRFKVMELTPDGSRVQALRSGASPTGAGRVPDDLCATLVREVGPYVETAGGGGPLPRRLDRRGDVPGGVRPTGGLALRGARYLMPRTGGDLFMAQLHITDHAGHSMLGHTDPESYYFDPACRRPAPRATGGPTSWPTPTSAPSWSTSRTTPRCWSSPTTACTPCGCRWWT